MGFASAAQPTRARLGIKATAIISAARNVGGLMKVGSQVSFRKDTLNGERPLRGDQIGNIIARKWPPGSKRYSTCL
jgi:hypothetical protein